MGPVVEVFAVNILKMPYVFHDTLVNKFGSLYTVEFITGSKNGCIVKSEAIAYTPWDVDI